MNKDFLSSLKALLNDYSHKIEEALGPPSYRYVGLNYIENKVLSYKFYFSYIGIDVDSIGNGIPDRIFDRVLSYRERFSHYHFNNYHVPGCGITTSIKFSPDLRPSHGVYFRIKCHSEPYVERFLSALGLPVDDEYLNKFDRTGVMKYVSMDEKDSIVERTYIYCTDPGFLDMYNLESGFEFSRSDCVEISTDWDHCLTGENVRMIGISRQNIEKDLSSSKVDSLKDVARLFEFVASHDLLLHGYYINRHEKSVFFFDEAALGYQ